MLYIISILAKFTLDRNIKEVYNMTYAECYMRAQTPEELRTMAERDIKRIVFPTNVRDRIRKAVDYIAFMKGWPKLWVG